MGKQPLLLAPAGQKVSVVACHPKQEVVAVGYDDGLLLLVRIEDGAEIIARRPAGAPISAAAWSGTGLVDWLPSASQNPSNSNVISVTKPAENPVGRLASFGEIKSILMLCHQKPNYIPDLLLHGLRKLLGVAVVDYPRKTALYDGCLGQPYLDPITDLMSPDTDVDRSMKPIRFGTAM